VWIALTTDDGYKAEGFRLLAEVALDLDAGPVVAVAPDVNRSGVGSGLRLGGRMEYAELGDGDFPVPLTVLSGGTPVDCVRYALQKHEPDLIIAGINNGANVGHNILTSGTCCAAMFAARWGCAGVPGIAVSQHRRPEKLDLSCARDRLLPLLRAAIYFLDRYGPCGYCFANINLADPDVRHRGAIIVEPGIGGYDGDIVRYGGEIGIQAQFCTSFDRGMAEGGFYDDNYLADGYDTVSLHERPIDSSTDTTWHGGDPLEISNGRDVQRPPGAGAG